jgi:hypothetical protein
MTTLEQNAEKIKYNLPFQSTENWNFSERSVEKFIFDFGCASINSVNYMEQSLKDFSGTNCRGISNLPSHAMVNSFPFMLRSDEKMNSFTVKKDKQIFTIKDLYLLEPYFFSSDVDKTVEDRTKFEMEHSKINNMPLQATTVYSFSSEVSVDEKSKEDEDLSKQNVEDINDFLKKNVGKDHYVVACEGKKENCNKNDVVSHPLRSENLLKFFFPKQNNQLFWCIYVYVYGFEEYNTINSRYSNVEIEEHTKIMNYFKENPHAVANSNMKITQVLLKELMSELLTSNNTSILSLYLYALYYKINIYLVNSEKHTYVEFLCSKRHFEAKDDFIGTKCREIETSQDIHRTKEDGNFSEVERRKIIIFIRSSTTKDTVANKGKSTGSAETTPNSNMNFSEQNVEKFTDNFEAKGKEFNKFNEGASETSFNEIRESKKSFSSLKQEYWSMSTSSQSPVSDISLNCEENKIEKEYFKLENAIKPLKCISNYKMRDLEDIYIKLNGGIPTLTEAQPKPKMIFSEQSVEKNNKFDEVALKPKMKKQDLYNAIYQHITLF